MIDIGVLGLDTSHPESFAAVLADRPEVTISAVWDGGTVRDDAYVNAFCDEHGARRYEALGEMTNAVDAAMVLTVDWGNHERLAVPFLEAGVPTLIDKPVTGRLDAIETLERVTSEAPLFGGSAVPFHPAVDGLPRGVGERTLFAAGYNDYFYYRVHLSDVARLLADADWRSVEPVEGSGTTMFVTFENDTQATLRYDGSRDDGTFGILDVSTQTRAIEIPSGDGSFKELYEPYLLAFIETVRGNRDDTARILDSARLGLAVEVALERDKTVTPSTDGLSTVHISSERFVSEYEPYY